MSDQIEQTRWTKTFIRALVQAGVRSAVISPGYRNTSLVSALLEQDVVQTFSVFDERAAAYLALGQARVTRQPSLLICTSGTASAHYLPAIIEARYSGLPLLVITADRPLHLDQCGAPQTINQINLFGHHVRGFFELGDPRGDDNSLRALIRKATQAYEKTTFPVAGPVHINFRSEKPLELNQDNKKVDELFHSVRASKSISRLCDEDLSKFISDCLNSKRGLMVAGALPLLSQPLKERILSFAQEQGFVLHAEATSQLRFSSSPQHPSPIIDNLDGYLRNESLRNGCRPDLIVQIGKAPVSKGVQLLLQECSGTPFWVISPEQWNDADNRATVLIRTQVEDFFEQLTETLGTLDTKQVDKGWQQQHASLSADCTTRIQKSLSSASLTEGQITRALLSSAPEFSTVFAANGLPVRHLDTFGPAHSAQLDVLSQRGTSGIDGQISGVLGAATVSSKPIAALIGDIGFLHDISALANSKLAQQAVVFVVINNGGGRIFEQLPVARTGMPKTNWEYWTTPQNFNLAQICEGYGVKVESWNSLDQLVAPLEAAYNHHGVSVLDAQVAPDSFYRESQLLWEQ
ncbi:MAG: 2-succinyl-5-enolpyruvyl-6-hydroxy-3-cyclohexene-1-carboxylic-acid synthase [Myxococcota bacterium]|nr:2-succinyl-5-enolpyruvyl-6-hydroxy-3-cyclohexene-1-carboxylic-acid synthase [Myxococcota bacterium]